MRVQWLVFIRKLLTLAFLISTSRCVEFGHCTPWVLSLQHNLLSRPFIWHSRHFKSETRRRYICRILVFIKISRQIIEEKKSRHSFTRRILCYSAVGINQRPKLIWRTVSWVESPLSFGKTTHCLPFDRIAINLHFSKQYNPKKLHMWWSTEHNLKSSAYQSQLFSWKKDVYIQIRGKSQCAS